MSDVIDRPILAEEEAAQSRLRIIDCDVHPSIHAHSDLDPFLPKRWQEHLRTYGSHLRTPYIGTTPYPRSSPLIARRDAWPPTGGPPGSNLEFMQKQHLDPLDVEFGILQVLDLFIFSQQNLEFGAAIQRAINDWQLAFWSHRDPRLKASILVGQDDTQLAIAEIERCAKTGEYVQINVCPRANEPLGRRRYWPIYERAEALDLPLGIHVGGYGGSAPTACCSRRIIRIGTSTIRALRSRRRCRRPSAKRSSAAMPARSTSSDRKPGYMTRYIVARTTDIPPGGNKVVGVDGRDIVI